MMSAELGRQLEDYVTSLVADGRYGSKSEVLREGVRLNDGLTRPARARLLDPPPEVWERQPPIRVRQSVPTAWLELAIGEGRNRQVRRMTAAVGHPTLRLIRAAIGPYTLEGVAPGTWRRE